MKRIILTVAMVLVLTGQIWAEDVPVIRAEDEAKWLEDKKPKPAPQSFEWQGQNVTAKEFDRLTEKQQKEREEKLKEIRRTGVVQYDEEGRVQYKTPDGVVHSLGMSIEDFITQNKEFDHAETARVQDAVKRQAEYEAYVESQKNKVGTTTVLVGEYNATEAAELAEIKKIHDEKRAKNKKAFEGAGLPKW